MKVWVNGSFDILHIGHMRLLEYASELGDVYVGVDTDERIKQLKGDNRPFNNLSERMEFLRGIRYVKDVVSFDSDEELIETIKNIKPNFLKEKLGF